MVTLSDVVTGHLQAINVCSIEDLAEQVHEQSTTQDESGTCKTGDGWIELMDLTGYLLSMSDGVFHLSRDRSGGFGVAYAYPSSDIAASLKKPETGCWYLYRRHYRTLEEEVIRAYDTPREAEDALKANIGPPDDIDYWCMTRRPDWAQYRDARN